MHLLTELDDNVKLRKRQTQHTQ